MNGKLGNEFWSVFGSVVNFDQGLLSPLTSPDFDMPTRAKYKNRVILKCTCCCYVYDFHFLRKLVTSVRKLRKLRRLPQKSEWFIQKRITKNLCKLKMIYFKKNFYNSKPKGFLRGGVLHVHDVRHNLFKIPTNVI